MQMVYKKKNPQVGDFALFPKTVSASDVMIFSGVCCDANPLFVNDSFGETTVFGSRVVPPMLIASMVGGAVYRLCAPDAFPLKREFETVAPMRVGDTLTSRAEVTAVDEAAGTITLKLEAYNNAGELVLRGTSVERTDIRKAGE